MSLQFEWDSKKASVNLRKHKVSFDEATTVFEDPLAYIFDDEDHSEAEHREIMVIVRGRIWAQLRCADEKVRDRGLTILGERRGRSQRTAEPARLLGEFARRHRRW